MVWNVSDITEFRQALENAAANGESDRIVLAKGTYNVISDNLGTLIFNDNEAFNLTIEAQEGLTFKDVILDGNNSTQVFNFDNTQSSTLLLKNISVVDGNSSTSGGGVYSNQNIKVEDCNISHNSRSGSGGGLYSTGTTIVINSTISNNSSNNAGGFYSHGKTTILNSTISNNNAHGGGNNSGIGGGFYSAGVTTITNSIIFNNTSHARGGGFYTRIEITITNSIISSKQK